MAEGSDKCPKDMDEETEVITIDDDEEINEIPPSVRSIEILKTSGNNHFARKEFETAISLYTEAIALDPQNPGSAVLYSNRAACFINLRRYNEAIQDIEEVLRLDSSQTKAVPRLIKCRTLLGDFPGARQLISEAAVFTQPDPIMAQEILNFYSIEKYYNDGKKALEKEDYRMAIYFMDQMIRVGVVANFCKSLKAECLLKLGRRGEALEMANSVLLFEPGNVESVYVRSVCFYYEGQLDNAVSEMQRVLRLDPDNKKVTEVYKTAKNIKTKKEEGNAAFKSGRYESAYQIYTEAIQVDPNNPLVNAKLYCNRAMALLKMQKYQDCLKDCSTSISLDPNYDKPLLRRAQCYTELEQYQEALTAYEELCRKHSNSEYEKLRQEAITELNRSKRIGTDHYKVLNVKRTATINEIRKAYLKLAKVQHPDRHVNKTAEERAEAERKFKETETAYRILTDEKKRMDYDNNFDDSSRYYQYPSFNTQHFQSSPFSYYW